MEYSNINFLGKELTYAMYEGKLAYFGLRDLALSDLEKDFPHETFVEVESASKTFENELDLYKEGNLKVFNTELYISGTPFQKSVYEKLMEIPFGTAVSYSDVSILCGDLKKVRAVANAVGRNRHLIIIPCHRVISKDGSLGGFSGGLDLKKKLLEIEDIAYKKRP